MTFKFSQSFMGFIAALLDFPSQFFPLFSLFLKKHLEYIYYLRKNPYVNAILLYNISHEFSKAFESFT